VLSAQFPCVPAASAAVVYEFRRLLALEIRDAGIKLAGVPPAVQIIAAPPEEPDHHAIA
jgi:hypothetical protein